VREDTSQPIPANPTPPALILIDKNEKQTPKPLNEHYFEHKVQPSDSLASLSLRYGVSIEQLKRTNGLFRHEDIKLKTTVIIPKSELKALPPPPKQQDDKRVSIQNFIQATKATREEANFYLHEAEYNLELAIGSYSRDVAWEKDSLPTKK